MLSHLWRLGVPDRRMGSWERVTPPHQNQSPWPPSPPSPVFCEGEACRRACKESAQNGGHPPMSGLPQGPKPLQDPIRSVVRETSVLLSQPLLVEPL